uniref:Soluble scavenger receptor cysteine-rich domain-containing protein SSC5D n=1 Tax=Gadus morhua TaxID=8049 RepID=A0A8C5ARL0_GADMO
VSLYFASCCFRPIMLLEAEICKHNKCLKQSMYLYLMQFTLPLFFQQIRLVNGMTRCSGRVEVLHEGQWGSVCDDAWGLQEAEVVCRQMKCGTALGVKYQAHFGPGAGPILLDDLGCNGQERTLGECKHAGFGVNNCGHSEDAGVECSGIHFYSQFISKSILIWEVSRPAASALRPPSCSGRVEVFHRDTWGTVCDDGWTLRNTEVVCNSLDCGTALEINPSAFYGQGKGMIWLDDVQCTGQETSLLKCKQSGLSFNNCGHGEDVGVVCLGSAAVQQRVFTFVFHISPHGPSRVRAFKQIRLVNGTTHCSGRVEVLHEGQWGSVCGDGWGLQEAEVACREMKCGTALGVKYQAHFGQGAGPILLDDLGCNGQERALGE